MNIFKPTSKEDIIKILGGKINVMKYSDLKKYNDIYDAFYPYDGCIVLYESAHNSGHWVLIYGHEGIIYFFDSYGFKYPNDEMNYLNPYFNDRGNRMLLYDLIFKYPVYHNDVKYQNRDIRIKTCGLWCCARYLLRDIPPDEFRDIFLSHGDPDIFVCLFIDAYMNV